MNRLETILDRTGVDLYDQNNKLNCEAVRQLEKIDPKDLIGLIKTDIEEMIQVCQSTTKRQKITDFNQYLAFVEKWDETDFTAVSKHDLIKMYRDLRHIDQKPSAKY